VANIKAIEVNDFWKFMGVGEVLFLVFNGFNKKFNFLVNKSQYLLKLNLIFPISKDYAIKFFILHELESKDVMLIYVIICTFCW